MWQILLYTKQDYLEQFSEILESFCETVSFVEIPDENADWDSENWYIEGHSLQKPSHEDLIAKASLIAALNTIDQPEIIIQPLQETNWLEEMWEKFPPQPVGPFFIYGTGYKGEIPQDAIAIHLNAATAFGSGEHQTTKGCLLALFDLAQKVEWEHPLDLGCGSGILAIAMAKLKKANVLAIDNDSESVRVTKENALLNTVGDVVHAQLGNGLEGVHNTFDLIVANILAKPLIMIADMAFKNLCSGGYIILSGLLDWQQKDVEEAYKNAGFTFIKADNYDRWMTLVFQKI